MISRELTVLNRAGIHARPAAEIAKRTSGFSSDIFFIKEFPLTGSGKGLHTRQRFSVPAPVMMRKQQ